VVRLPFDSCPPRLFVLLGPVPRAAHPAPVGRDPFGAGRRRLGKRQSGETDALPFAAVLAHDFEAAIIVDFNPHHRHLDAEDAGRERHSEILLDHGEEPARLFLLIVAIDRRLLDQLVQLP
jgi:hypothetical protein